MENTLEQLEQLVINWADEKGILVKATQLTQFNKTQEEVSELKHALDVKARGFKEFINKKGITVNAEDEIEDAIGDIVVTLIIQAKMQGLTLQQCLQSAYNVISKRSGEMIDGVFVKSEDLNGSRN
jgi:NTP pyrophosphatase (non-canonical NTP hydrolase)